MRLEEDEDAARLPLARSRDRGGDLARMMRVVVDDRHPACLADELETAADPSETRQRGLRLPTRHAGELECDERGRGVAAIVLARERELERGGVELPAANGVRRFGEQRLVELAHLGGRRERRVVVELDV